MIFGLEAFAPYVAALILILLFASFALELRSPEVSALAAAAIMLVLGVLSTNDLLGVLSNSAPVTIGAMFIISAALVRTGVLDALANAIASRAAAQPRLAVLGFFLVVAAMSAVMNNTPLVMLMIPIAIALAEKLKESGSRLLIPLSYVAILGGTCTLIGTSTNILVDGVAREQGLAPFHMLEIAPLGIVTAVVGVVFLALTRGFLPERTTTASLIGRRETQRFMVEIVIEDESPYIGARPLDVKAFNEAERRVVDVIRGDASLRREMDDVRLMEGDIVVLRTPIAEILAMKEQGEMKSPDPEAPRPQGLQPISTRKTIVVEILLAPGAHFIGRTLRHLRLRRRYGVYPVALHRRAANLAERFETTPLEVGDTLLIEGAAEDLKRLCDDNDLVNVAEPSERPIRRQRAPLALATIFVVVVGASLGVMPIAGLAVIGAAVVLATRCIEPDEAFAAVDWRILTLILAMLAIGKGLENTGLVEIIVDTTTPVLSGAPPIIALALVYLLGSVLTEIVTNNAVAVILTPIVIALAHGLGVDARPFVVAVMFAASASFMTPIGYQTNTLVYSVGGYKFADYFRLGLPLHLITTVLAITLIPIFWPFHP
ncbi:MAG: SLC13 family permease [Pseudomonadota bacterium]|nr:SLC13 family permease [Pseudomonadota bacterium]